jgi:hypothetical protein
MLLLPFPVLFIRFLSCLLDLRPFALESMPASFKLRLFFFFFSSCFCAPPTALPCLASVSRPLPAACLPAAWRSITHWLTRICSQATKDLEPALEKLRIRALAKVSHSTG